MNKKETTIIIRLTKKTKEKLQQWADKEGRTISNLVRYVLENSLKKRR